MKLYVKYQTGTFFFGNSDEEVGNLWLECWLPEFMDFVSSTNNSWSGSEITKASNRNKSTAGTFTTHYFTWASIIILTVIVLLGSFGSKDYI